MAALAADLEAVRLAVQAAVGTRNKTWKDSMWSDFVKDVVSFLIDEKSEDSDDVVEAAVGLIVYGATTQEKLQGVSDNKEEFKRQLADKYGVPAAICDMLFAQYVARSEGQPKMPMPAPEEVAKEYLDGVIRADVGGHLELPEFDYPASFPRNEGAGAVTLRGRPGKETSPNMLLAGLERDVPLGLSGELLGRVLSGMDEALCMMFGVLGAGKTRLICEALSQRFVLLFVVSQPGEAKPQPELRGRDYCGHGDVQGGGQGGLDRASSVHR